jgi:hypothetical protein
MKRIVFGLFLLVFCSASQAASFLLENQDSIIRIEAELDANSISRIERTNRIITENPGKFPEYDESGGYILHPLEPNRASAECHSGFPADPVNAGDGHCVSMTFTQLCHRYYFLFRWVRRGAYYRMESFSVLRTCHEP